jgi:hypothetical protein
VITLAVYGPVTHIARRLSGGGLIKALTVQELAEGYQHDPPTDFTRLRGTSMEECRRSYPDIDWPSKVFRRTWDDQTCTEFLVLVTLNAMQQAGLATSHEARWSLTDKAITVLDAGGSLLQAISGNVFTYTEDEKEPTPEEIAVELPDRNHSGGPKKTNPDKETWSVSYTKESKTLRRSWATLEFDAVVRRVAEALGCETKQDFLDRAIEHYLQSVLLNKKVSNDLKDEVSDTLKHVKKMRQITGTEESR